MPPHSECPSSSLECIQRLQGLEGCCETAFVVTISWFWPYYLGTDSDRLLRSHVKHVSGTTWWLCWRLIPLDSITHTTGCCKFSSSNFPPLNGIVWARPNMEAALATTVWSTGWSVSPFPWADRKRFQVTSILCNSGIHATRSGQEEPLGHYGRCTRARESHFQPVSCTSASEVPIRAVHSFTEEQAAYPCHLLYPSSPVPLSNLCHVRRQWPSLPALSQSKPLLQSHRQNCSDRASSTRDWAG